MELVRKEDVRPQPPARESRAPEPYRVLFPIGVIAALAGLLPWVAYEVALRLGRPLAWPGEMHAAMLLQGFELAFICGFMLTSMPAFTHGPRCTRGELAAVTSAVLAFVLLRAFDVRWASWAWLAALVTLSAIVARRVRPGAAAPPEEFLLVATGMALGLAGGVVQALVSLGVLPAFQMRAGLRCISLGMLPALVLGLGSLLVPTFARMKDPLDIIGLARAGDRPRRRGFVLVIAALLVLAVNAEFVGMATPAAWLRTLAVLASTQLAWKLWRLPGRSDRLSWSLWTAGWCVAIGFTWAALAPVHRVEAWHVAFVGGYALLTLAIGTRVVVSHGGHAGSEERVLLSVPALASLALALLVRALGPTWDPVRAAVHHAIAAGFATLAFALWLRGAWPRVRKTRRGEVLVQPR
jgi:uncharacterized protein involved in response to NO